MFVSGIKHVTYIFEHIYRVLLNEKTARVGNLVASLTN